MPVPPPLSASRAAVTRFRRAALLLACVLGVWAAYCRTFHVPFLLDDVTSVVDNATIRHLGNLREVLSPPAAVGTGGRPVANLVMALNYAWTGLDVWSYHLVNLFIHTAAGLVLFALVRRTLRQPGVLGNAGEGAAPDQVAGVATALWLLHPVQTNAVTYIAQRSESLAALLYLSTLYCFARGCTAIHPRRWFGGMVAACFVAIGTKETAVTAPVMVLLYDRTFAAGSFAEAWRRRQGWYLALASSWLLLGWLMQGLTKRGAGLGIGVSPFGYALTSCRTVLHYLRLTVWPHPLVFDYGPGFGGSGVAAVASVLAVVLLVALLGVALRRSPASGFALAWFLVLLAPTTSFVPVAFQPVAESRMYLPIAGLLTAAVVVGYRCAGSRALFAGAAIALAFGLLTFARNGVYHDALALWTDTLRLRPQNGRAYTSIGSVLVDRGQAKEALPYFEMDVRLEPGLPGAHNNLGNALLKLGRIDEAMAQFRASLALAPENANSQYDFGNALLLSGKFAAAAEAFRHALKLRPNHAFAAFSLGNAERDLGHIDQAVAAYRTALGIQPEFEEVHRNLGAVLSRAGRIDEALAHLQRAVALQPDDARAQFELGYALARNNQLSEAEQHLRRSIARAPDQPEPQNFLGLVLASRGNTDEAIEHIRRAIALQPDFAQAHNNLASLLARTGHIDEARTELETAIRLEPDYAEARANLARLNQQPGR